MPDSMPKPRPKSLNWQQVGRWLGLLIVLVASVYFVIEVSRNLEELRAIRWDQSTAAALFLSLLGMLVVVILGGVMWGILLHDQGGNLSMLQAIQITTIAQIAKYLPGNVGHFIGVATLTTAAGVPLGIVVGSLLISTLWLLSLGTGMGAVALLFFVDVPGLNDEIIINLPFLLVLGLVLASLPWICIPLVNRFLPGLANKLSHGGSINVPRFRTGLALGMGFLLCFFIFGLLLKIQAHLLFGIEGGDVISLTFLFTAAWVAGYVMPGAPGGLGVREAMMLILLSPVMGPAAAAGVGIFMRIASIGGDGLAFLFGWGLKKIA